ncbi:large ribosomal subunit protein uL18m [Chironomus tepperi]|uniref:large ribosomal subunit protein uL18m n=1 Tax=Chironomus tepperi TaxID=113505 RepID=UPI00391FC634
MTLPRRFPHNKQIIKRIQNTVKPEEGAKFITNRNPRNLEFLRIAEKPKGYFLDTPFSKPAYFWHKLVVTPSAKYVTAELIHHQNGVVLEASTKEWAIKKQLFKTSDTSAYINLARVFANRCLECGITEMTTKPLEGPKIEKFMSILRENGLVLTEPPQIDTWSDLTINRYQGKRIVPNDWKEIVEEH